MVFNGGFGRLVVGIWPTLVTAARKLDAMSTKQQTVGARMQNKTESTFKYFDILTAVDAYKNGKNVTETLRLQKGLDINTSEIIEIAYDLQAGTYIELANGNAELELNYSSELSGIIQSYMTSNDTLLDVGTGEITTLSSVARQLKTKPLHIYAFDISWSRLFKGIGYANEHMGDYINRFTPFVADMIEIPLLDKSINITISCHALEPNGGRLLQLLSELFRITRDTLLLFEPCYELNTDEGKKRMDSLGYIKGMDEAVNKLGGKLIDRIPIKNVVNPLTPTTCFVVKPPLSDPHREPFNAYHSDVFSVPGSNHALKKIDNFYFSNETGLCFPIIKDIPILKPSAAILASALSEA